MLVGLRLCRLYSLMKCMTPLSIDCGWCDNKQHPVVRLMFGISGGNGVQFHCISSQVQCEPKC